MTSTRIAVAEDEPSPPHPPLLHPQASPASPYQRHTILTTSTRPNLSLSFISLVPSTSSPTLSLEAGVAAGRAVAEGDADEQDAGDAGKEASRPKAQTLSRPSLLSPEQPTTPRRRWASKHVHMGHQAFCKS